ncbi:MAG: hypothetical protein AB1374_07630 [Bacillota bacterium]
MRSRRLKRLFHVEWSGQAEEQAGLHRRRLRKALSRLLREALDGGLPVYQGMCRLPMPAARTGLNRDLVAWLLPTPGTGWVVVRVETQRDNDRAKPGKGGL